MNKKSFFQSFLNLRGYFLNGVKHLQVRQEEVAVRPPRTLEPLLEELLHVLIAILLLLKVLYIYVHHMGVDGHHLTLIQTEQSHAVGHLVTHSVELHQLGLNDYFRAVQSYGCVFKNNKYCSSFL